MSIDIVVPAAGESISEGELATWHKNSGDVVEIDEIIGEVETEKASLEIRAPSAGRLEIIVEAGTSVKVGQKIAAITAESSAAASSSPTSSSQLQKRQNQQASESSVKSTTLNAHLATQNSNTASVASKTSANSTFSKDSIASTTHKNLPGSSISQDLHPTPAARKLMREHNLTATDVAQRIPLNNAQGRIHHEHVKSALSTQPLSAAQTSTSITSSTSATPVAESYAASDRSETRTKISRLRSTIAKRLVLSQQTGALLTTFNEIDMHAISTLRSKYKDDFKKKFDVGLGFMSFFVKATVLALRQFPVINSRMDAEAIIEPHYIDIGVAVATPKGLVVPVLRNVATMNFQAIEAQIKDFALRGKAGKLTLDELSGGTFTISNGGVFGSMLSTPIVNYPQSAILGMHNIVKRPVVFNDEIVIHPVMYVALSYDHRLIDGAQAVQFLYRIKEMIEDPSRLLINV